MNNRTKIIFEHILNIIIIIPFLLTLATVFVINNNLSDGIISGKYFWFYGSMGLVLFSLIITCVISGKKYSITLLDIFLLLFISSIYISALHINNISLNFTKITILTLLIVLYFSVRLTFRDFKSETFNQNLICIFIVLTGLVEAVWGLLQLYGFESSQHSLFKITGSFFNPGPYSGYLALVFPLALYYGLYSDKNRKKGGGKWIDYLSLGIKWLSIITCITFLLILPAAMSRAAWFAVIGGSAIVLCAYVWENYPVKDYYSRNKAKVRVVTIISCLLFVIALIGAYLIKKDSADGRALMWKVSLRVIKEHPLGVGLGNFSGVYGNAQAEYMLSGKASEAEEYVAGNPEYAFNEYLQILVESGIPAGIFFIMLIGLAFRNLYRSKRWGIMGALVSLLIFACFSYPFSVLPYLIVFVFLLAMSHTDISRKGNRIVIIMITLVVSLVTVFCLFRQYPVYKAYKKWNKEKIYYQQGLYKEVGDGYRDLYPFLNDNIKFLFEYAQGLSKSGQYAESNQVLSRAVAISCDPMLYNIKGKNYQSLKEYEKAEKHYERSLQIVPNRIYPYYLLAKLYDEMGRKEKACEMASIVTNKNPKVYSGAIEEMRNEVKAFDYCDENR